MNHSTNIHILESLDHKALGALPFSLIQKLHCFAFSIDSTHIHIATDPNNPPNMELVSFHIHKQYPHLTLECYPIQDFLLFYQKAFANAKFNALTQDLLAKLMLVSTGTANPHIQENDINTLLDFLLEYGIQHQSSDIHIESNATEASIRYRIDGILHKSFEIPLHIFEVISTRLKLECKLDISEKRKSLDGRFSRDFAQGSFDFRFSSMPALEGESLVLRILQKGAKSHTLQSLGFLPQALHLINQEITKSSGMILLVGPTGCGKSTTLYAMIESIKDHTKKILTLEDPIEYRVDDITQVLINPQYDFTFEKALRGCLRQDPDVLMIGEIRDHQTLDLALQASLTGHLIFATLHANDTLSAFDRILALGGKPQILATNLSMIIAQRLARKLCTHCKYSVPHGFYDTFKDGIYKDFLTSLCLQTPLYRTKGCVYCDNSGFSGRILLSEILQNPRNISNLSKELLATHLTPMQTHITEVLTQGMCSLEEVYRVWG